MYNGGCLSGKELAGVERIRGGADDAGAVRPVRLSREPGRVQLEHPVKSCPMRLFSLECFVFSEISKLRSNFEPFKNDFPHY